MAEIKLLPLPEWGGAQIIPDNLIRDYARANMEPLIAEIEALRAELAEARDGWHMANGTADLAMKHRDAAEARAEGLAEALREAKGRMLGQVKWVACDCGCEREKPADAVSVAWLRASALLREQEEGSRFWPEMPKNGDPDWTGFDG